MYYFTYSSYCPHIINPSKYHSNPCFVDCISKLSKVRLLVGGGVETPGNLVLSIVPYYLLLTYLYFLRLIFETRSMLFWITGSDYRMKPLDME